MITLYPQTPFPERTIINTPAFARRNKTVEQTQITPQQAKVEAARITSGGLSPRVWRTLDLLATAGVLSSRWLPKLTDRAMRRLGTIRLIERLSLDPAEIKSHFFAMGLEEKKPILYTLGPVGAEIAAIRFGVAPPSGYQAYLPMRIMHDIAANEVILRLADMLGGRGWKVEWLGKYESVLSDRNGKFILEPDAVIRFRKGEEERSFVLEYHNEDWQSRAFGKVEKYEKAFVEGNWLERWEVETFPPVLTVFQEAIVGAGYQNATRAKKLQCKYYGKKFSAVLEGKMEEWINVSNNKKEILLPTQGGVQ